MKGAQKKEISAKKEFWGIKELIENGKYDLAVDSLEDYLQKYPGNSYALKEYASILRQQGKIEEALNLLSQSEEDKIHIINERAICFVYMEEYELALQELQKLWDLMKHSRSLNSFCRVKLGICDENDLKSYVIQQAACYDKEKALNQIKTHTKENGGAYFALGIPIEEIYHNICSILPAAKTTITDDWMTAYIFQINGIGYNSQDIPLNYLKVATLPNSYDIITMTPYSGNKKTMVNNYETLLTSKKEVYPVKNLKRESQLDKFNRRYGKINNYNN